MFHIYSTSINIVQVLLIEHTKPSRYAANAAWSTLRRYCLMSPPQGQGKTKKTKRKKNNLCLNSILPSRIYMPVTSLQPRLEKTG